jgi:hypothetical protein
VLGRLWVTVGVFFRHKAPGPGITVKVVKFNLLGHFNFPCSSASALALAINT